MRLQPLMDAHRGLDALLAQHQEALIGLELDRARERLDAFAAALGEHIAFEDAHVLPVYEKLPRIRHAPIELFTGEHEKLAKLLADIRARVAALDASRPGVKREVVTCFDRTALFKGLLEHHDLREGQYLYPRLDETLTADDAERLIRRLPAVPS